MQQHQQVSLLLQPIINDVATLQPIKRRGEFLLLHHLCLRAAVAEETLAAPVQPAVGASLTPTVLIMHVSRQTAQPVNVAHS